MKMKLPALLLASVFLPLAGCADKPVVSKSPVRLDSASIPKSGIMAVKDVVVVAQGGDRFELTAAANDNFTQDQLMAVLWCRARELSIEKKYDGWFPLQLQQVNIKGGNAAVGKVQMYRGAAPAGKKNVNDEKNWCLSVPPQSSGVAAPAPVGIPAAVMSTTKPNSK